MTHQKKKKKNSGFAREIFVYIVEDFKLVARAIKYKQVGFIAEQEWTQIQINTGQGVTLHVMEVSLQRLHVESLV